MADAIIPVDLRNPGQVFACLGLMEAAEILIGPAEGGYDWTGRETRVTFHLSVDGPADPVLEVVRFLAGAEVKALAPAGSGLAAKEPGVATLTVEGDVFPCPRPDTPSALPALLVGAEGGCGAVVAELVEDERVVGGGSVEGDLDAGELTPPCPLVGGVTDDDERRDDDLEVGEGASGGLCACCQLG